ncbi:MAG TPA: hypothetical protein VME69_00670 [Methylocella sp.]|nr:hypothetical protein [Methylocella sp.]
MSLLGKWRIVAMPDYESDFPDMPEPAYILLGKSGDEFALPVRSTDRSWRCSRVHLVWQ